MNSEAINKISDEISEGKYSERERKNMLLKALTVLAKYSDDINMHAEHDELNFGIDNYEDISEKDIRYILNLAAIGWSEEYDCFYYFT